MGYLVISATVVADFYLSGLDAGAKSSPTWSRLPARCGFAILFPFVPAVLLGRVYFWAPGLRPTLRQCHKTSRIFMGIERILRVAKRCSVIFLVGLFLRKKGLLAFWVGALSPSQKALPKIQTDLFLRKQTVKMTPTATLGNSARSCECL